LGGKPTPYNKATSKPKGSPLSASKQRPSALDGEEEDVSALMMLTQRTSPQSQAKKEKVSHQTRVKPHTLPGREALERYFDAHIANPYPNDVEKKSLALEMGLESSQVGYWFTNTRKRFWIPAVNDIMAARDITDKVRAAKLVIMPWNDKNGGSGKIRSATWDPVKAEAAEEEEAGALAPGALAPVENPFLAAVTREVPQPPALVVASALRDPASLSVKLPNFQESPPP
jgi:hypothetical protein